MRCVLVHAAGADARMWDPVVPWFAGHEPVAYDLRGHGQTDDADGDWHHVDDLLDVLANEPAVLVGASMGGRVALEAAMLRPELVLGLVLLATVIDGWEWQPATEAHDARQQELLAAGDADGATALYVDFWVVGPGRPRSDVPRPVRELAFAMRRRAFAIEAGLGPIAESPRVAGLLARLPELGLPALVAVGEHDVPEMHDIARAVAGALRTSVAVVANAAHLVALEQPAATGRLVERFLGRLA